MVGIPTTSRQKSGRIGVPFELEPLERDLVASEEVLHLMGRGRPTVAHHPSSLLRLKTVLHFPVFQQVIEYRVKLLLGRVPRL